MIEPEYDVMVFVRFDKFPYVNADILWMGDNSAICFLPLREYRHERDLLLRGYKYINEIQLIKAKAVKIHLRHPLVLDYILPETHKMN